MAIKTAIAALALAWALLGCSDGGGPAGRDGSGGQAATGGAGSLGGSPATGGAIATGGRVGTGGSATGGTVGTGGSASGGTLGTGGAVARGGSGGGSASGGAAGGGAPPSCESLGWHPGSASLCGASKGGYECAACADATGPVPTVDCVSSVAAQGAIVLCASCGSCR